MMTFLDKNEGRDAFGKRPQWAMFQWLNGAFLCSRIKRHVLFDFFEMPAEIAYAGVLAYAPSLRIPPGVRVMPGIFGSPRFVSAEKALV